ncbi:hypothetical protein DFAR_1840003 [Desulfarculales bacterium]
MTLALLWEEYKAVPTWATNTASFVNATGNGRARWGWLCARSTGSDGKTFIDYAGQTVDVVVPLTGEVRVPQILVAVLSASNYTFAAAT